MEPWLTQFRKVMLGDQTVRTILIGGTVLLVLIVIVDAFGARDRATAAREAARLAGPASDTPTAVVPSVYRVPRDLASEAAAARAAQQTAQAETLDDTTVEDPSPELAEVKATEEATQDMAADAAPENGAEPELPEAEATEEAAQDMVADATTEDSALALLDGADIANGQRVWRQCGACHVYDAEQNRGGPHLVNIIGREVGTAEGWRYSSALSEYDDIWTVEALLAWLENPDSFIPGNQMAFRGLRNEQDRIDILGFLNANRSD